MFPENYVKYESKLWLCILFYLYGKCKSKKGKSLVLNELKKKLYHMWHWIVSEHVIHLGPLKRYTSFILHAFRQLLDQLLISFRLGRNNNQKFDLLWWLELLPNFFIKVDLCLAQWLSYIFVVKINISKNRRNTSSKILIFCETLM